MLDSPSQDEKLVAIMGPTGSGKSSLIKRLFNVDEAIQVGHGLRSCTSNVYVTPPFTLMGQRVRLIDTPGFDDTTRTNTEILEGICQFLDLSYRTDRKLSGLIYLHKITDNRVGGISVTNMKMFQKLCGDGALKNVVLCTTMWDMVDVRVGQEREDELKGDFWSRMLRKGASTTRHDDSLQSARAVVSSMLGYDPVDLQIQDELVNQHKTLLETAAGEEVNKEILKLQVRYEEQLVEIQQQMQEALAQRDIEMQAMIEEDRRACEVMVGKMMRNHEVLGRERDAEMVRLKDMLKEVVKKGDGKDDFWPSLIKAVDIGAKAVAMGSAFVPPITGMGLLTRAGLGVGALQPWDWLEVGRAVARTCFLR